MENLLPLNSKRCQQYCEQKGTGFSSIVTTITLRMYTLKEVDVPQSFFWKM
jgi:hypothetical protein